MGNDGSFEKCMVMRGCSILNMKKYTLEHFYACHPYFLQRGELIEIQNTGVAPNLKHNFVQ